VPYASNQSQNKKNFGENLKIDKQLKQKLKALYNATVAAAEESGDTDLIATAKEMKSNDLLPDLLSNPVGF